VLVRASASGDTRNAASCQTLCRLLSLRLSRKRNFQDATVPFVGRTDDTCCSGITKACYRVRDKLHVAKSPDRLVDNRCDPFHKRHGHTPTTQLHLKNVNILVSDGR
jgi:hypothetical protein